MFGGMYVSGALTGMLREYLDNRGIAAPACRIHLDAWAEDARIPLAEWIGLLHKIAKVNPRPALPAGEPGGSAAARAAQQAGIPERAQGSAGAQPA